MMEIYDVVELPQNTPYDYAFIVLSDVTRLTSNGRTDTPIKNSQDEIHGICLSCPNQIHPVIVLEREPLNELKVYVKY